MGCCFSTPNQLQNDLKTHKPHLRSPPPQSTSTHEAEHRSPPPPPAIEEESVKEVLSETPISKSQVSFFMVETKTQMPEMQNREGPIFNKAEEEFSEEVSQITETCSMSESFSTTTTATTTLTEKREDEATSKRSTRDGPHNRNRSHSKRSYAVERNRNGGRGRRPKSPARAPEKRIPVSSRSVCRTDAGQVHRDPGDGYVRRSRSPASSRTVSAAAGRIQVKPPGGGARRIPPPVKEVEWENDGGDKTGVRNDLVPQEESLENPHVSLECFIFL